MYAPLSPGYARPCLLTYPICCTAPRAFAARPVPTQQLQCLQEKQKTKGLQDEQERLLESNIELQERQQTLMLQQLRHMEDNKALKAQVIHTADGAAACWRVPLLSRDSVGNRTGWTRALAWQLSATTWRLLTPTACWHHAACSQLSRRILKLSYPVHAAPLLACCGSQLQAQESQLRQELLLREASLLECHQQLQEAKALLQVCGERGGECHCGVCRGHDRGPRLAGGRNALGCSMLHETHKFPATGSQRNTVS